MIKIIRVILAIIVFTLSGYILLTDEYKILPYTILLLGIMVLITGIAELHEKRKVSAIISFLSAVFGIFVGIYILFS